MFFIINLFWHQGRSSRQARGGGQGEGARYLESELVKELEILVKRLVMGTTVKKVGSL